MSDLVQLDKGGSQKKGKGDGKGKGKSDGKGKDEGRGKGKGKEKAGDGGPPPPPAAGAAAKKYARAPKDEKRACERACCPARYSRLPHRQARTAPTHR